VLDAGDLLLTIASPSARANPTLLPPDPAEITRRAELILSALARAGLTAFTPGERDLDIGPPLLRRLLAQHKIPALAANLYDERGKLFFDADRVVDVAGVKIGLFGLVRALPEDADRWKAWHLDARDPAAAARDEVVALHARGARIVIAMVHAGPYEEAKKILQAAPGIDWAVLGHSALNLETPDEVTASGEGGSPAEAHRGRAGEPVAGAPSRVTRVVEAMSMGKDFGRLDLHFVGESGDGGATGTARFVDRGRSAQLLGILRDHEHQIADYRARAGEQPPIMQAHFAEQIAKLDKAIANDRQQLREHPAEIHGSWFENRVLPLDAAIPDQPGVALLVAAYNRENQRRASAGLPVGVSPHLPTTPHALAAPATEGTGAATEENLRYAGTVACGGCHAAALKFWQTTAHARALATLKRVKRDRDPTCIGCHVTGFMRPGGTGDLRVATARLRDVGCESCHGPGLDHANAENAGGGHADGGATTGGELHRQVAESACLGCHTPDQTGGDFNYAHYLKAILGPGHGGV